MKAVSRLAISFGALLAASAAAPAVLDGVEGGLWEVSRSGSSPVELCVADVKALAQFEHRNERCARTVIRGSEDKATIHYQCPGGGFGQTVMTEVTEKSLRIETQGISATAPFKYLLQARRVGDCPGKQPVGQAGH
jgi:hypothetical protein